MTEPRTIPDLTLAAFVAAVGEPRPSPGAGAAGAVALALAAACARKAFGVSVRHGGGEALVTAAERCAAVSAAALEGAVRDAEDFAALLKGQAQAPRSALEPDRALSEDGSALLILAAELKAMLASRRAEVSEALVGDLLAAEALLAAFVQIQRANLSEL